MRVKDATVVPVVLALGFGLCKTATSLAYITAMGSVSSSVGFVSQLGFMFAMTATTTVTALSIIALVRAGKIAPWSLRQTPALITLCAGFLLGSTGVLSGLPSWIATVLLGGLCGYALTVFMVVWLEAFVAEGDTSVAIIQIVCALIVQAVLASLLLLVPGLPVAFVSIAFLLVSASALVWVKRRLHPPLENRVVIAGRKDKFTLLHAYLCLAVVVGVVGILHTSVLGSSYEHIVGDVNMGVPLAVSTIITALVAMLMVQRPNPVSVYKVCFPCMLLILSLLPFLGNLLGPVAGTVMITCYDVCGMVFLLFIVEQSRRVGVSSYLLTSLYMVASSLFLLVGLAIGIGLSVVSADYGLSLLTLLAFAAIYPLAIVLMVVLRRSRSSAAAHDEGEGSEVGIAGVVTDEDMAREAEAAFDRRLDGYASDHDLTKREREILGYLARGRSAKYIADVLVISENTVWAHIKRVYAKTGIHSKQELMSVVDRLTGDVPSI